MDLPPTATNDDLSQTLETAPELLLRLHLQDKQFIEYLLSIGIHYHLKLTDSGLNYIAKLAAESEGDFQNFLCKILGRNPPRGLVLLAELLNSSQIVDILNFGWGRYSFKGSDAEKARTVLSQIASDESLPLQNRITAIHLLGYTGSVASEYLAKFKQLESSNIAALAEAARIAISRIENSPTPESVAYDLQWIRKHDPFYLQYYLRDLALMGSAAHSAGPMVLKELAPFRGERGAYAAITLAFINYRPAIPTLIDTLGNKEDWLLVATAAEALGRLKATEAEAALIQLSQSHWNDEVREAAIKAVASIHGDHTYDFSYMRNFNTKRQPSRWADPSIKWNRTWWEEFKESEFVRKVEELRRAWLWLSSPIIREAHYGLDSSFKRTVSKDNFHSFSFLPQHRISMGEAIALGYDGGEWGSGVAYVPAQGVPTFIWTYYTVVKFIRWNGKTVVVTSEGVYHGSAYRSGMLHYLRVSENGTPSLVPYMRIPAYAEVKVTRDGILEISSGMGSLNLSPD